MHSTKLEKYLSSLLFSVFDTNVKVELWRYPCTLCFWHHLILENIHERNRLILIHCVSRESTVVHANDAEMFLLGLFSL